VTELSRGAAPLPQRRPPASEQDASLSLPRRTAGPRRAGRHRSLHRLSVASDAPTLVLAVPGSAADDRVELAEQIAESAAYSCPGVDIRFGYLRGGHESLDEILASGSQHNVGPAPQAVVVPLLAGPHPAVDAEISTAVSRAAAPVMLAARLGPHPLLAGALHDRLSEVGLARASRARGINIAAGGIGVLVVADRGPEAMNDAGVAAVLLAARLAIPTAPASLGDRASIQAALERLLEAGASRPAIAPYVIGPESDPGEFGQLSAALSAPCAAPLGAHQAVAQLVAVRYGEALARISITSH